MKLRIGIIGGHPGWQSLFQQEGVSYSLLDIPDLLDVESFSAVILHRGDRKLWSESITNYVKKGGALLTTSEQYSLIFNVDAKNKAFRYLLPTSHRSVRDLGLIDLFTKGSIIDAAQLMVTNSNDHAIYTQRFGDGMIAALPVDLGIMMLDGRVRQKAFYSSGKKFPSEIVSLVSKGEVRKLFRVVMEYLHHQRGLPYCHLWYFPDGASNIFLLRVDTDFAHEREINTLHHFSESHNVKLTWFVHVQNHGRWLQRFAEMEGHEIGVHCYRHAVLQSYGPARVDLKKALELLRIAGVQPVGFAAPYGQLTEALLRLEEELGFLYSSEFSFDYDNMPSYPVVNGRHSSVLQVPVHPICIGSFRGTTESTSEIHAYFDRVVAWKRSTREPLFFYHHPHDGYLDVLGNLIQRCKENDIPNMVMKDFALWWKEREAASYTTEFSGQQFQWTGNVPSRVHVRISTHSGEAILPFQSSVDLSTVAWKENVAPATLPEDIYRIRQFSVRRAYNTMQIFLTRERL